MKTFLYALLISISVATAFAAQTSRRDDDIDAAIDAAIENSQRPDEDKKADERRHPRALLQLSQAKSGDTVVDLFPGRGYFTRLFAGLVGPKGHVIAFVPKEIEGASFKPVEAANKAIVGFKNAEVKVTTLTMVPAQNVDVIWTSQNYHDLHIPHFIVADVAAYNKLLFKMLKPGGYLIVVDHVAKAGAPKAEIEKLHRIDPAQARKEIEAAGFVLEDESKILSQKEDHSLNVFDPAIRGKTDQFAYRFVKPKK